MSGTDYHAALAKLQGEKKALEELLRAKKREYKSLRRDERSAVRARALIQKAAVDTQQELEFRISDLVTLALGSVFPDSAYRFRVMFVQKRGKTEAKLRYEKDGQEYVPIRQSGGGTIDISALALRLSFWGLPLRRSRGIFVFDEPFKNINDETREMHRKAAAVVRELADKLDVQFIISTQIPELIELEGAHVQKITRTKRTKRTKRTRA